MKGEGLILFTVGHSTHSIGAFLGLLKQHRVTAVADVRSQPYSRLDHFNREALSETLKAEGIEYAFMGRELGARRDERECYVNGRADYAKIAELPVFRDGLSRLRHGATMQRIAVMCAEKEPLDCHRAILICRHLRGRGIRIRHILADGGTEDHEDAEKRLVRQMGVVANLFEPNLTEDDLIDRAYDKRTNELAYHTNSERVPQ